MQALTIEDARRLFASPVVRVLLDWDSLVGERVPVSFQPRTAREDLLRLRTTWYLDRNLEGETDYHAAQGPPLLVGELAPHQAALNSDRLSAMGLIARANGDSAVTWLVPCYALPDGGLLLLDGNHRLGAMALHKFPARVLCVVIHGPLNAEILPDLKHWT